MTYGYIDSHTEYRRLTVNEYTPTCFIGDNKYTAWASFFEVVT